jgi:hypothetical protein
MTPRTLDVKFPCSTQLVFGSLSFAIGEDGELKMLPPGPAPGSGFISGIKQILLRIGSQCRKLHPNRQDRSGYPGCDIHPLVLGRGIKLIHIGIDP